MTDRDKRATTRFYESELEGVAMDLLSSDANGMKYIFTPAENLHREIDEVLIVDDLNEYLHDRYPDLSEGELARIQAKLRFSGNTPYETNRTIINLLANGFDLTRDNPAKEDIHIELADFSNPDANIFRVTESPRVPRTVIDHTKSERTIYNEHHGKQEALQEKTEAVPRGDQARSDRSFL